MAKGKRYSDEYKEGIAKRLWDGEVTQDVANEIGVHYTTLLDWKSKFKPRRKVKRKVAVQQSEENTRVSELEKKVAELTMEKDLWREAYKRVITNQE